MVATLTRESSENGTAIGQHSYQRPRYLTNVATVEREQLREFIQNYIKVELWEKQKLTHEAIAKMIGVSKVTITNIINHGRGAAGPTVVDGFARKFHGGSVDRLNQAAKEWYLKHGSGSAYAAMNPELAVAIEFLRGHPDPSAPSQEFLDGWLRAHHDQGWKGVNRDGFIRIITAAWYASKLPGSESAASDLEMQRDKKRRERKER